MHSLNFEPIGHINSCYKEKFGIPRQPSLVKAKSQLILSDIFNEESVRGLEGFTHIWLQFVFHQTKEQGWKPMVRPPRLGGNKKVGVFASRSTFRPNPIGLSVVELVDIDVNRSNVCLNLLGCDLVDETPVLDIKPYLPYVDSIPNAEGGFAREKPRINCQVSFTDLANYQCDLARDRLNDDVKSLIIEILRLDPRPSYQNTDKNIAKRLGRIYQMKLYDFDLSWQYCENNNIKVLALKSEN